MQESWKDRMELVSIAADRAEKLRPEGITSRFHVGGEWLALVPLDNTIHNAVPSRHAGKAIAYDTAAVLSHQTSRTHIIVFYMSCHQRSICM